MNDVFEFARALWRQWKVLLTGGSLMAVVVIYSFASAQAVTRPWGAAILAATFMAASFGAWRGEFLRNKAIDAELPHMSITHATSFKDGSTGNFSLYVHLVNPGKQPISFSPEWRVDVELRDGRRINGILGVMRGQIRPMQQGDQFDVTIIFPFDAIGDPAALTGASYTLSVTDIYRHRLVAEYAPEQRFEASD